MQFSGQDIFVGAVAIGIGLLGIYCSLVEHEGFFRLQKVRWLESRMGRTAARWVCVLLAAMLILFGSAIAMGFSLQRIMQAERAGAGEPVEQYRLEHGPHRG